MSEDQISNIISILIVPVSVYLAGRIAERFLGVAYRKITGELSFKEEIQGDLGVLTIQSNSAIFLDEVIIHLEDKSIEILKMIREKLGLEEHDRIQFSPLDKIRFECLIQAGGDKRLHTYAFIGTKNTSFFESLDVRFENPKHFMQNAEISIETPRKRYRRSLFLKIY